MKISVEVRLCTVYFLSLFPRLHCNEENCASKIKPSDLDEAILRSQYEICKEENSEKQLIKEGKYIDSHQISAEARHQIGSLPKDLQRDYKYSQNVLENTAIHLAKSFSINKRQVESLSVIPLSTTTAKQILEKCVDNRTVHCRDSKYRSFDGRCNNLHRPNEGRTFTCHARMIPPDYADGIQAPRQSSKDEPLPNARLVTVTLTRKECPPKRSESVFLVGFGQFIDHDIALTAQSAGAVNNSLLQCCPKSHENGPECYPIEFSEHDPDYPNRTCINFVRAQRCAACSLGRREQMNTVTPVVDCSQVYGTSETIAKSLRMNDGSGKLRVRHIKGLGDILPRNSNPKTDQCSRGKFICFKTGDVRANQHPILQVLHTISVRLHNYVVDKLKALNQHWKGVTLYHEARRIVIAIYQHITYCHYLPIIVGQKLAKSFSLCDDGTKYWESIPAILFNSAATAGLRFAHSTVPDNIETISSSKRKGSLPLKNYYFNTKPIYKGLLEDIIRGISKQRQNGFDHCMAESVTDFLYRQNKSFGLDLSSINIQRGRDHGLPGFSLFYQHLFGLPLTTFADLFTIARLDIVCAKKLRELYKSLHDVDLFVGLLCEIPMPGALIGRMGAHIVAKQFYNLKYGDRYFYTHKGETGSFTEEQRKSIRMTTMSTIICAVTRISKISRNVMDTRSSAVSCHNIYKFDFRPWRKR